MFLKFLKSELLLSLVINHYLHGWIFRLAGFVASPLSMVFFVGGFLSSISSVILGYSLVILSSNIVSKCLSDFLRTGKTEDELKELSEDTIYNICVNLLEYLKNTDFTSYAELLPASPSDIATSYSESGVPGAAGEISKERTVTIVNKELDDGQRLVLILESEKNSQLSSIYVRVTRIQQSGTFVVSFGELGREKYNITINENSDPENIIRHTMQRAMA